MALNMFNQFDDFIDGKPIRTNNNQRTSLNRNSTFNNHKNKLNNNQSHPINYNKNNAYYNSYRTNIASNTYKTQPDEYDDHYYNNGYYKKNNKVNRSNSTLANYQRHIYPVKTRSISEQNYNYPIYNQTILPNIAQKPQLVTPIPIMPSWSIFPSVFPSIVPLSIPVTASSPTIIPNIIQSKPPPIVNKIVTYPNTPKAIHSLNTSPTLLRVMRQNFY